MRGRRELAAIDAAAGNRGDVIDAVAAGEQQPESDHFFAGVATRAGGQDGVHWRNATGWFSYVLKDSGGSAGSVRVRMRPDTGGGQLISLNGVPLTEALHSRIEQGADVTEYAIPAEEGLKRPRRSCSPSMPSPAPPPATCSPSSCSTAPALPDRGVLVFGLFRDPGRCAVAAEAV